VRDLMNLVTWRWGWDLGFWAQESFGDFPELLRAA